MKEKILNKIHERISLLGLDPNHTPTVVIFTILTSVFWLCALPVKAIILGAIKCNYSRSTRDYIIGASLIAFGLLLGCLFGFFALSIKYALNK
jgi:hypothetical protein